MLFFKNTVFSGVMPYGMVEMLSVFWRNLVSPSSQYHTAWHHIAEGSVLQNQCPAKVIFIPCCNGDCLFSDLGTSVFVIPVG
jgi:hypothetical protein